MASRLLVIVLFAVGLISGKTVEFNLDVIEEGGDVVSVRSHRLSLRCTPTHRAQVEWTYNNVPIPKGDQRRYVDENGSLIITKVIHNKKKGESDAGIYQCKLSNSNGAILSTPIKLSIAGISHEFTQSPNNQTVVEGNLMRLTCSIESTPKANISWVKDGEPLSYNKRFVMTENELFISHVKSEDGGSYQCNASNSLVNKVRLSNIAEVTVIRTAVHPVAFLLPESHLGSNLVKFRLGEKGHLICAASGIPRPNVKWISNRPDGANLTYNTTYNGLNIFTIEHVTEEDGGAYTCNATQTINGITSVISRVLNVDVEVPPVIVDKPKSQVYPAAKTVRIECGVRGSPTPQVVWYKDGAKLHINGRIKQRTKELVLGAVVTQDSGAYQCFASSQAGIAWAAGRLVVNSSIDQPAPPTSLICKTLSGTEVSLAWNQLIKSDLKAFSVHYFPTEGGEEGKDVALNDTYVVSKLQPYTNYTFYIRSYSAKSASEQSKRVICKTAEAVPTGAPQLTVISTSSHCVTIEWTPPPISLARGTIVNYKIQWKKSSHKSAHFDIVSRNTLRHVISGLSGGADYLVRVIGATALGWPELSETQAPWSKISTPPDKSSALQPSSVQVYSINSTTIEVVWNYEGDSYIDGFKIDYRNSINEVVINDSVPSNVRLYQIPVLAPSKWYDVSVRAYLGSTEGYTCLIRYNFETLPTRKPTLAVPNDLDAVPLSQNSINVTWSPYSFNNSTIFRVYFPLMYSVDKKDLLQAIDTNRSYAVIAGLKPRTYYRVSVQALTPTGGMSSMSSMVETKTLPEVLGLVDNIGWRIGSNSTVELTWDPLTISVTGYTVFYSARVISENDDHWQHVSVPYNRTTVKLTDLRSNINYVVRIRGESGSSHGPLSAETFISLPPAKSSSNGHTYPKNVVAADKFLGILVGISIGICCIALCTGSLLYRKKCIKPHSAQVPSSFSENGQCSSVHCERSSMASIEMKDMRPTSLVNGMKSPLISNGNLPNGSNREKVVRIIDNPQGRRGERSSSHSTDEGDSLLSGPEIEMETEEPTQLTLLVDSSILIVSPCKETAPDDGFHETHVSA